MKYESWMKPAFGGVLIDSQGRVLLRRPKGGFYGESWTFPKGKPESDATPEETALREVLEETGYRAEIVREVPGSYAGTTTVNRYYVMRPNGEPGDHDWETEEIRWVSHDEAVKLITSSSKAERDLQVLAAAYTVHEASDGSIEP